jgi:hypothetical protein
MLNDTQIYMLLQGLQHENPRLHDLLRALVQELQIMNAELFPPETATAEEEDEAVTEPPDDVVGFTYTLIPQGIQLSWDRANHAAFAEIREGIDWATSVLVLLTGSLSAVLPPRLVGTYNLLIKGVSVSNEYSVNATPLEILIPPMGNLTVSGNVIDNNVLLSWTIPTSAFAIDHYEVFRDGVSIGEQRGTFAVVFEQTAGSYEYSVIAVDIAGNQSAPSAITLAVSQPPDYLLEAMETSVLDGTRTDMYLDELPSLIGPVSLAETWEEHFDNNGWNSPQDQIDAGYPLYAQPGTTSGEYEEIFDYGAVFDSIIINLEWSFEQIAGNVTVVSYISTSTDGVNFSPEVAGKTIFAASVRYVKVRIEFTQDSPGSLYRLWNLRARLDVRQEIDSGNILADEADPTGTPVTFNKAFLDINSITVSVDSTVELFAVYDFVDVPNPTGFSVYVFDSSGNRVTATVSWKARGVM